jgi:hypothetical protein
MKMDLLGDVAKAVIYSKAAKKGVKALSKNIDKIDWDADAWLHKIGLSTYKPARLGTGGFGLFVMGALAGGVIGLLMAPKKGAELRTELRDRALDVWAREEMTAKSNTAVAPTPLA